MDLLFGLPLDANRVEAFQGAIEFAERAKALLAALLGFRRLSPGRRGVLPG